MCSGALYHSPCRGRGGERGIINTKHRSKRCKNLISLWHKRAKLCSKCPMFSGSIALPPRWHCTNTCNYRLPCKACLQRRTANPHAPVASNHFWSSFFLTLQSGWFCGSLQPLWKHKVEGLGAHSFPVRVTVGSLRLSEATWAPFCAWSMFVRLALNNKAKKSSFLSQLLLQMRLKSTCLLGRGDLCSKLCGCRL